MSVFVGLDLLDADGLRDDMALWLDGDMIARVAPRGTAQGRDLSHDGQRALICPGMVDLQVNGGGGLMLGDCRTPGDVLRLVAAHRGLGTTALMPTLISASPATTARIIELVAQAQADTPAILGLHLEGPHLGRAGAHDPGLLRPMTDADLDRYLAAKARLGTLIVTLAPDRATPAQIATLAGAGVVVSLGHSDCDYDTARAAFGAGAAMGTHLFNAMSPLSHRAPGMVGAILENARFFGVIADGVHVHPAALRTAIAARPEAAFLVSDAMAVAGTGAAGFDLDGRRVGRKDGALRLADGTLAGADLDLLTAARNVAGWMDWPLPRALQMGFATPMRALGLPPAICAPGARADLIWLADGQPRAIWQNGDWQAFEAL